MSASADLMTDTIRRRFTLFLIILVAVLAVGVSGYILIKVYIEGYDSTALELVVDAIYWTVITLTTLGSYPSNVALFSVAGKVFTVVVVLMGIVLIIVAFPLALSPWFESRLKEVMTSRRTPIPTANHVIVCGYNDVGKEVVQNLRALDIDHLVIENKPTSVRDLLADKVPSIIGDPTRESVLTRAHLDRALALISVENDSVNAFVALTASRLRADLRIVSSIQHIANATILRRAGATQVLAPKTTVGALLASEAVGRRRGELELPTQVLGDLGVGHFKVSSSSNVIGKRLGAIGLGDLGLIVVGLWRQGVFHVAPERWTLQEGDIILLLGPEDKMGFVRDMF